MKNGVYLGPDGQLILIRKSPLSLHPIVQWQELEPGNRVGIEIPWMNPFVSFSISGWEYLGNL
jgi:hypothetical protein